MTDRLRRLRPLLPTNTNTLPPWEESASPTVEENAPLPPRLGERHATTQEPAAPAMTIAATATAKQATRADEEGGLAASPPGQDPYIAFALRWWWLLILGALIGGIGAYAYTQYGPVPFQSIAQVQVPAQTTTNPNANSGEARSAATNYVAEATSTQMFTLVSKELAGKLAISASDLQLMSQDGRLEIRLVKNTNFISIAVTDPDPERARLLADTIAIVFVRDVNSRASTQLDTRGLQLEQQIKITQDRLVVAQLLQRQEALRRELMDQRGLLLQLQLGYQQELQRQQEADRLAAAAGQTISQQVLDTRSQWLKLIGDQIAAMETTINGLNAQLNDVETTLKNLPSGTDLSVSAAFAAAYSEQLDALTREFAQLQLSGPNAREPVIRYGVASDPLPASGLKKMLLMGLVAGMGLAAGIGFLLDLLRQRRTTRAGERASSRAGEAASEEPTPVMAQPVAEMIPTNVATQRAPDLMPLPILPRNETPDVRWRRASNE
jgi:capsular polysaccharide biosynthesis protein